MQKYEALAIQDSEEEVEKEKRAMDSPFFGTLARMLLNWIMALLASSFSCESISLQ